jgi:hypothetical protein
MSPWKPSSALVRSTRIFLLNSREKLRVAAADPSPHLDLVTSALSWHFQAYLSAENLSLNR